MSICTSQDDDPRPLGRIDPEARANEGSESQMESTPQNPWAHVEGPVDAEDRLAWSRSGLQPRGPGDWFAAFVREGF